MSWKEEYRSLRRSHNHRKMGGQQSKQDILNNGEDADGTKKRNLWDNNNNHGFGSTFLPSFLRRRKMMYNKKYCMDATTSRFFLGDDAIASIGASCSTDSIVSTVSDQRDDLKNTAYSKATESSSASGSSIGGNSSESCERDLTLSHDHGSNEGDDLLRNDRYPSTMCCVDDYLRCSTDSDNFIDRYDIFVSVQVISLRLDKGVSNHTTHYATNPYIVFDLEFEVRRERSSISFVPND
jgi:hypothetical protein